MWYFFGGELNVSGRPCLLSVSSDPKRKIPYTVEAVTPFSSTGRMSRHFEITPYGVELKKHFPIDIE